MTVHAYLYNQHWMITYCPNVGHDAIPLTDEQAALPWPHVTSDDGGQTFRAMDADEIANGPRHVQLARLAASAQAMLDASDCKVLPDSPYPADVPAWVALRAGWRAAIRAANTPGTDPASIVIALPQPPLSLTVKE